MGLPKSGTIHHQERIGSAAFSQGDETAQKGTKLKQEGCHSRVIITLHARDRMMLRGATEEEVVQVLREGAKEPAKYSKLRSMLRFDFHRASPVNGLIYAYKTVEVIFAEEFDCFVVLTVKVYYHND